MKILLSWQGCIVGGVETWMIGLCQTLNTLGHECEMFFFQRGAMEQQIPAHCVAHFGNLADCVRLVAERKFDVVHAATLDWELGISAVRRAGAKLVLTGNGWVNPSWTSANCDAIVGCSRWNAEEQQVWTDVPVQVVANGIDMTRFSPPKEMADGPPIIAWVGRAAHLEQKRVDKLAAMAPALCRVGMRLWIADPYGPKKILPSAAAVLEPLAEFWDMVPHEQMPDFFRTVAASGGCVLSTSSYEGLSLAYMEAQACGCPVIGPDVRGVNEGVLPEHGGMLYPFDEDHGKVAQKVLDALTDTEQMRWRRESCRRFVSEQFSLEKTASEYLRVYQEAPYRPLRNLSALRARFRSAPLLNYRAYVDERWSVGNLLYQTSQKRAQERDWTVAAALAREALHVSPTLYLRLRRMGHLFKTQYHTMMPAQSVKQA